MIYNLNDYFQTKDEVANTPTIEKLQGLVDTTPYCISAASLEDKALSMISPNFVFVSTNSTSYYMSTATGGAWKLDRRYMIINFRIDTEEFRKQYEIPKIVFDNMTATEKATLLSSDWKNGVVIYTLGFMDNSENNQPKTVSFDIKTKVLETRNVADVYKYIIMRQIKLMETERGYQSSTCKDCGQKPCICESMEEVKKAMVGYYVPLPVEKTEEEIKPQRSNFLTKLTGFVSEGGFLSIPIQVEAGPKTLNAFQEVVSKLDKALEAADSAKKSAKKGILILAVVTSAFMTVYGGMKFIRSFNSEPTSFAQGAMVTSLNIPKEEVKILPLRNAAQPWIKKFEFTRGVKNIQRLHQDACHFG
jgi:hypothetical protein